MDRTARLDAEQRCKDLTDEFAAQRSRVQELEQQLFDESYECKSNVEAEMQNMREAITQKDEEIRRLKRQEEQELQGMRDQIKSLQVAIQEKEAVEVTSNEQLQQKESDIQRVTKEGEDRLTRATQEMQGLKGQLNDLQITTNKMEATKDSEIKRITKEGEDRLAMATQEVQGLKGQLNQMQTTINKMEATEATNKEQSLQKDSEIERVTSERNIQLVQINGHQVQITQLETENRTIRGALELVKGNLATLIQDAIGWYGAILLYLRGAISEEQPAEELLMSTIEMSRELVPPVVLSEIRKWTTGGKRTATKSGHVIALIEVQIGDDGEVVEASG